MLNIYIYLFSFFSIDPAILCSALIGISETNEILYRIKSLIRATTLARKSGIKKDIAGAGRENHEARSAGSLQRFLISSPAAVHLFRVVSP